MKIGYSRVSFARQNLDRQIAALRSAGCDRIYREKASGKDIKGRPQLEKALFGLKPRLRAIWIWICERLNFRRASIQGCNFAGITSFLGMMFA